MPLLELSFAGGETSLSVRRFSVYEGISTLFSVSIWACSERPDVNLEAIVGQPAALRVVSGWKFVRDGGLRSWGGVISTIEQVQAVIPGRGARELSTYYMRLVPALWLLTQRRNYRIFQHVAIPDIADRILAEWKIEPTWQIDRGAYPKLEYKVQYGEPITTSSAGSWKRQEFRSGSSMRRAAKASSSWPINRIWVNPGPVAPSRSWITPIRNQNVSSSLTSGFPTRCVRERILSAITTSEIPISPCSAMLPRPRILKAATSSTSTGPVLSSSKPARVAIPRSPATRASPATISPSARTSRVECSRASAWAAAPSRLTRT